MDLSLNKLPWYGQVGLFVALGVAGVAVFYYMYVIPTAAEMAVREQRLAGLRARHREGRDDREPAQSVPRAGVPISRGASKA